MPKLSINTVLAYLAKPDLTLSNSVIQTIRDLVDAIEIRSRVENNRLSEAREKMDVMARDLGFANAQEMLRAANRSDPQLGLDSKKLQSPTTLKHVRKPYMSPDHPDLIFSVKTKGRSEVPAPIQQYLEKGWKLEEMHYKNLRLAAIGHGITLDWDPVERHAALAAEMRNR